MQVETFTSAFTGGFFMLVTGWEITGYTNITQEGGFCISFEIYGVNFRKHTLT